VRSYYLLFRDHSCKIIFVFTHNKNLIRILLNFSIYTYTHRVCLIWSVTNFNNARRPSINVEYVRKVRLSTNKHFFQSRSTPLLIRKIFARPRNIELAQINAKNAIYKICVCNCIFFRFGYIIGFLFCKS